MAEMNTTAALGMSVQETDLHVTLRQKAKEFEPFPDDRHWNMNRALVFASRQTLSRVFYLDTLYRQIVGVPGVICEFGVHLGSTLCTMVNLRGIHEPYNFTRKVVGFDTFAGFTADLTKGEQDIGWKEGDLAVPENYKEFLEGVLTLHEANAPIPHKRKFELVHGDVTQTFQPWLEANPHAVVAMAIFDMDVYAPTKFVLERIIDRMPKGGVLVFDELNFDGFPGETEAVQEVFGIRNLRLRHHPHNPKQAWCVLD